MGHQDQPLLPMVEHHRPVHDEEPDGGNRRRRGIGHRMAVEQLGCFEGEVAHQPAGERWKARQARGPQRPRDPDQPFADGPCLGHVDRDRPRSSGDLDAVGTGDDRRCRVARHERVPAPRSERSTDSNRTPGPSPANAGNNPTGVETSDRSSAHTGTRGHSAASASNVSRSGRTCSSTMTLLRTTNDPDHLARASRWCRVMRWLRTRGRPALTAPAPNSAVATRRHGRRL